MKKENIIIWEEFRLKGDQYIWGTNHTDGTKINRLEIAECNNAIYQFNAFIIWKFYLKMALDLEVKAIELCNLFKPEKMEHRSSDKKKIYKLLESDNNVIEEYFKTIITAYIVSFSALESYVNSKIDSFIPNEHDYLELEVLLKKKGALVVSKTNIIKECSTEDKLFSILPYYLKQGHTELDELHIHEPYFRQIQSIRNELIHPKRLEIRTSLLKNGTYKTVKLWNTLIPRFSKNDARLNLYPARKIFEIINYIEERNLKK